MKRGVPIAFAAVAATIASLAACSNQQGNQGTTSTSSSAPPGAERMTTQLKSADGTQVGKVTIDFASSYATVTVETSANQVLSPGFHGLQIHAVGKCEANSVAPTGGPNGDFNSAGDVYQAPNHTGYPASGDLTALQVRSDGSAKLVTTSSLLTAADLRNSAGTALIVHQTADNLGNTPAAESSKRVACGAITAAAATSSSTTTPTTSISTVTTTVAVPPPTTSTSTSTITVTSTPSTTYPPTTTVTTPPGG